MAQSLSALERLPSERPAHQTPHGLQPQPQAAAPVSAGCAETGSPEFPVVLLEVQMHRDTGFHHRLTLPTRPKSELQASGRC